MKPNPVKPGGAQAADAASIYYPKPGNPKPPETLFWYFRRYKWWIMALIVVVGGVIVYVAR